MRNARGIRPWAFAPVLLLLMAPLPVGAADVTDLELVWFEESEYGLASSWLCADAIHGVGYFVGSGLCAPYPAGAINRLFSFHVEYEASATFYYELRLEYFHDGAWHEGRAFNPQTMDATYKASRLHEERTEQIIWEGAGIGVGDLPVRIALDPRDLLDEVDEANNQAALAGAPLVVGEEEIVWSLEAERRGEEPEVVDPYYESYREPEYPDLNIWETVQETAEELERDARPVYRPVLKALRGQGVPI